jgi:hypothetical protein
VDLRADLDDLEKRKFLTLPGLQLRLLGRQPVASRYADYAIPTAINKSHTLHKGFVNTNSIKIALGLVII